jgi:hypothetical protein
VWLFVIHLDDLAAEHPVSLGKRSLNHVDPLHDAVALSVPTSVDHPGKK